MYEYELEAMPEFESEFELEGELEFEGEAEWESEWEAESEYESEAFMRVLRVVLDWAQPGPPWADLARRAEPPLRLYRNPSLKTNSKASMKGKRRVC